MLSCSKILANPSTLKITLAALGFRMRHTLKPLWSYEVEGVMWRLIPVDTAKIVGEVRGLSKKTASFFCLNQLTGEVLWEGMSFGESWWVGIEAVHKGVIFFHGFSSPDMPEHKRITAVDLRTGKVLWQNDEMTFLSVDDHALRALARTARGKCMYEIDPRTGAILSSTPLTDDEREMIIHQRPDDAEDAITMPAPLESLDGLLHHFTPADLVGEVEGIELQGLVVFSVHEKRAGRQDDRPNLRSTIKVIDRTSDELLFSAVVSEGSSSVASGSFFVQHDTLYFVRERNTLTAVHLPTSHGQE